MTPTATRLKIRLDDRYSWFRNQWFFKWHHIGGERTVEIDTFDGGYAQYAGIAFFGSAHDIYWQTIVRGVRKEIVTQMEWVEAAVRNYSRDVAIKAIDECAGLIAGFSRKIRRTAVEKDRILRGNGIDFPNENDFGHWEGTEMTDIAAQAQALKDALFPEQSALELQPMASGPTPASINARRYQVALSFAGEQREYVRAVADSLKAKHITVFYDEFEAINLWGKDGTEHFHQVFAHEAQYAVLFISADYGAKNWTRVERRAALSRQMQESAEYVLPVQFDETQIAGIPSTLQYIDGRRYSPAELATLIAAKIGQAPTAGKASDTPAPSSRAVSGEVTFDYGSHNGRFIIGAGPTEFETQWSKGSDRDIHIYNDPPSINGVAIAKGVTTIDQIRDASQYDFSSRARNPRTGEIVVLRNNNGFYAAIEVLAIDDDRYNATADALSMRYMIQPSGSPSFATDRVA